jgi:hypothetical protein
MSVDEIEKAIPKLSSKERARLLRLLAEMDDAEWDRQIEEDAKSGKLDKLFAESEADFRKGRVRDI